MTGIFGVIDPDGSIDLVSRLNAMGSVMTHRDWYVVETHVDSQGRVGLGRIANGILNKKSQPIWNADHTLAIVMAGEFYDVPKIDTPSDLPLSDEDLALQLYALKGKDFVREVSGAFVLAIWDARRKQLIIFNDRFGLYPTYIAQVQNRLIFAPEVKGILEDLEVDRTLRVDSVAEYMRFQRLLNVKTFFEGVNLFPPASILTYDYCHQTCETSTYWSFRDISLPSEIVTFDEAVEEGARLLRAAVSKMCKPHERIGVFLSGGLDSRSILGVVPPRAMPVETFTYGSPECRDIYYARQVARAAHAHHNPHYFQNGNWIQEFSDLHMQLTEGFQPWIHMHGITMLADVRRKVDINLSGLGDLIWMPSKFFPLSLLNASDDVAFNNHFYELYTKKYSWPGMTEAEEHSIYRWDYYDQIEGRAYISFSSALRSYEDLPYRQRAIAFNTMNHFSRHLLYHVVYGRSHVEYRLPYFDLELQIFFYRLPFDLGVNRRLQREILVRELPHLAAISASDDELPISNVRGRRTITKVVNKVKSGVNHHVEPVFLEHPALYADYESWFRTDLRNWAEDILISEKTLSRGIFNPDGLRSLIKRSTEGGELWMIGKTAPIMTLEMMLRHFFSP
jgi:asparagine synthase (glutamine-hydrolysing)